MRPSHHGSTPIRMGELLYTLGKGELLSLYWDPVALLQADLIKLIILRMEHAPLKGKKMGILVWHILPISSYLTVLAPAANMYGMYNQVKS